MRTRHVCLFMENCPAHIPIIVVNDQRVHVRDLSAFGRSNLDESIGRSLLFSTLCSFVSRRW